MGSQFEGVVHSGGGARHGGGTHSQPQEQGPRAELLAYTWAWKQRGEGWLPVNDFFSHFIKSGAPVHRHHTHSVSPPPVTLSGMLSRRELTPALLVASMFLFFLN